MCVLENGDNDIDDLVRRGEKEQQQQRDDTFVESLGDELRVLDVKVRSLSEENELCAHVLFGSAFEEAEDDSHNNSSSSGDGRRRIFLKTRKRSTRTTRR